MEHMVTGRGGVEECIDVEGVGVGDRGEGAEGRQQQAKIDSWLTV